VGVVYGSRQKTFADRDFERQVAKKQCRPNPFLSEVAQKRNATNESFDPGRRIY